MSKTKQLIDPKKVVKVERYLQILPTLTDRAQISKPTIYSQCKAGKIPHIHIDGVLHIILD